MFCKHLLRMKQFLTLSLFLLLANYAVAQAPANDNCSGAITLTPIAAGGVCPTTVYTNVNATDATGTLSSPNPLCFNGQKAFKDVWFKFTTPSVGGNLNYRITIKGVAAADSIKNPQIAMYIGDCGTGLFPEYCTTKFVTQDTNAVSLEVGCIRSATTYFIQVGSYLSTDVGGKFTVCLEPIVDPVYWMRAVPQTTSACVGTIYDSGGPNGNYKDSENGYTFNIRPAATGCIELRIDSLSLEANYDSLVIFDGNTNKRLDRITGSNNKLPIILQLRTDWVQLKFYSDEFENTRGFKASWRSLLVCNPPAPTSCGAPDLITSLPFSQQGATTCTDELDAITTSPCLPNSANLFLQGKDHIYKYKSAGAQCIKVTLSGIPVIPQPNFLAANHTGANIGIYLGCPGTPGATCVKTGVLNTTRDTVFALNVTLDAPGDYYFVVSRRENCMSYNLQIDTIPCLNRLPNAGSCSKALSLNDCSNQNPSDIVLDLSVQGDSTFYTVGGGNNGCIAGLGGTGRYNFAFLYFQAKADGKFGFTISPISTDPTFDIDFNLYGGFDNLDQLCNVTRTNNPVRSAFGVSGLGRETPNRMQGMVDSYINPITGLPVSVTDTCEGSGGDGMVKRLDVKQGKYYAIWINDYNGSIGRSGVRMNFGGTTNNVLTNTVETFTAGRDTIICPGGTAQLFATGGITYQWKPAAGLSSDTAARPTAKPTVSTAYSVSIQGTCRVVPKVVNVGVFAVKDVPNQTVCKGEELTFDAGIVYPLSTGAVWSWTSSTGHLSELNCINCPTPTFKATNTTNATETHQFTATLTTLSGCVLTDNVTITVTSGQVAKYEVITSPKVARDTNICIGAPAINLLKQGFDAAATYTWTSVPASTLTGNNPSVTPTSSTKYYLTVTGGAGGCTAESKDSVIVNVYQPPTLTMAFKDTTICKDAKLDVGRTVIQSNTTYSWDNTNGLSSATTPNPTVTVLGNRQVYTLLAQNPGCSVSEKVTITGVNLTAKIDTVDSLRICRGVPLILKTATTPLGLKVKWGSDRDFSLPIDSVTTVTVNPITRSLYYIAVSLPGCTRRDSTTVYVDSLPKPTNILPQDTTVCNGTLVLLRSPAFEPIFFPGITFKWTPSTGLVTGDSLYNVVIQGDTTRTYKRLMKNGVCSQTDSTKVNVNPNPVIVVLPKDTVICNKPGGNNIVLTASSVTPNVKDWKWTGPQGAISEGDGKTSLNVTPGVGANRYTVTAKVGDCPGSSGTTITVKDFPRVAFPADPTICKDSSITLNTSPNSAYTYSWSGPSSFTSTASAPRVTPAASATYSVTVSDGTCSNTSSVDVKVATATLTMTPNTSICSGNALTLTATAANNLGGAGTIRWNTGATSVSITPPTTFSSTYTATYTYGNGKCAISGSTVVTSVPGFFLRISPDTFRIDRLLDQGTPLTLNAVLTGTFTSPTFAWTNSTGTLGTTQTINIKPQVEGGYKVSVVSGTGCTKDTSINIGIRYPNYAVPNAFTPNGDTINAYFGMIFNDKFPPAPTDPRPRFWKGRIEVLSFQVFSRWGAEIYTESSTTTLNSATYKGWDGKKGTNDVASDVYVYVIKLRMPDDSIRVEKGELNLIR